jgi:hypothetical protein
LRSQSLEQSEAQSSSGEYIRTTDIARVRSRIFTLGQPMRWSATVRIPAAWAMEMAVAASWFTDRTSMHVLGAMTLAYGTSFASHQLRELTL